MYLQIVEILASIFFGSTFLQQQKRYLFQIFHMMFRRCENQSLLRRLNQVLKNVQQHSWNKEGMN